MAAFPLSFLVFSDVSIPNFNDTDPPHWIRDVAKISLRTAPEEVFDAIRVLEKAKKLAFFHGGTNWK